jgi:hypothetical protein
MPNVRVSERTFTALRRYRGWLEMQTGKKVTLDETIAYLLERVDMKVKMYVAEGDLDRLIKRAQP